MSILSEWRRGNDDHSAEASAACGRAAGELRRELQNRSCDPELLAQLYCEYNPLGEPRLFVARALEMFPWLCCGLASVYARHRLGGGVVVRGWYGMQRHTVLSHGGWVIDLTADQFGGPEVYVGPLRHPWRADREYGLDHISRDERGRRAGE